MVVPATERDYLLAIRDAATPCYDDSVEFEWDPGKAVANLAKHGVSFEEAISVFGDPLATTAPDPNYADVEERWLTTGISSRRRVLIVWHTNAGPRLRIIGAREATSRERRTYESGE